MVPATLAHYRIVRPLGAGGMGEVFLADDGKLGRKVALKVLAHGLGADPERRGRFEREARAVAALNHPNIITIYSVEEQDGFLFLTMELVEGKLLGELIPRQGMSLDQLLLLAIPLTDAVGAAGGRMWARHSMLSTCRAIRGSCSTSSFKRPSGHAWACGSVFRAPPGRALGSSVGSHDPGR